MSLTPKNIQENANGVRTRIQKSAYTVNMFGEHKIVVARSIATDGPRTSIIRFYDPLATKNLNNSEVWVWCDCPYFMYHVEVVLTLRGSSAFIQSNAAMPKIRNPQKIPHLCKHLFRVAPIAAKAKMYESRTTLWRLKKLISKFFAIEEMF